MFVAAMLGGGLLGVVIERFAYRRLRDAPRIAPLITALGVSFFLENAALLVLGANYQSYDTFGWKNGSLWSIGFTLPAGVHVALAQIIVVVGTIVLMVGADLLRQPHAARPGDARNLVRPPGRRDDGHRRQPRDRGDVLHRLGARRAPPASSTASSTSRSGPTWASTRASRRSPPPSSAGSATFRARSSADS